jgi:hypothetical protein
MRKLRVNIFDDDVYNLTMLKLFMSQRDYEILTFDRQWSKERKSDGRLARVT